jgi:F-type H+-transporting ATPase subunit c
MSGLAMAAEAGVPAEAARLDSSSLGLALTGAAIAMAIAAFGCGIGQGLGLKAACEGLARNPEADKKLTTMLLLGLAFIESLAIYTLVISLLLIFANPFA